MRSDHPRLGAADLNVPRPDVVDLIHVAGGAADSLGVCPGVLPDLCSLCDRWLCPARGAGPYICPDSREAGMVVGQGWACRVCAGRAINLRPVVGSELGSGASPASPLPT